MKPNAEDQSWRRVTTPRLLSPLWLLVALIVGFVLATLAMKVATNDRRALVAKVNEQRQWSKELERENEILVMRLEAAEQSLGLLREDLADSRQTLLSLERDNTFYKGLVSPGELQSGIKLHRFDIEELSRDDFASILQRAPEQGEKLYRYEAIVAHVGGRGKKLEGGLTLSLRPRQSAFVELLPLESEGTDSNESSQLVVIKEEISHKLRFRFFQRIRGQIKLPANYEPARIVLQAESNLRNQTGAAEFETSYLWQDLAETVAVNTPEQSNLPVVQSDG